MFLGQPYWVIGKIFKFNHGNLFKKIPFLKGYIRRLLCSTGGMDLYYKNYFLLNSLLFQQNTTNTVDIGFSL